MLMSIHLQRADQKVTSSVKPPKTWSGSHYCFYSIKMSSSIHPNCTKTLPTISFAYGRYSTHIFKMNVTTSTQSFTIKSLWFLWIQHCLFLWCHTSNPALLNLSAGCQCFSQALAAPGLWRQVLTPHGGYLFAPVQPNTASSPLSTKEGWASKALLWLASITKHKGLVFCPSPLTSSLFYNILKYALLSDNLNSLLFLLLFPKSPYVQILTIFKV